MDDYAEIFSNNHFKIIALTYSTILTIVITPLMYSIISLERDNHHRTLINQLVSSVVWVAIFCNITVQPFTIYRYIFGPSR
jgi:hypothetical protein